uniref:Proline-serine-threonine phosphatase interacting protein 2 n=1 Tax=Salarias fasciatus TaxID=181472 RepID=A0A672IHN1_SALFA
MCGETDVLRVSELLSGLSSCQEDKQTFLKVRIEPEKYAKDLLGLSRKVCGHNEMSERSLDLLKATEQVSLSHLQLAHSMREEARKLEEFREKQKEARKKVEQTMDALHKQRSSQFRKTADSKKTYEQKCRDKEEADQNVNRNANNAKHLEKLYSKAQQAKQNAEEAGRCSFQQLYQQNVGTLGRIRDDWIKEHIKACEVFEKQSVERLNFLRNTCVTSDELYEEDIEHFINLRQTGDRLPGTGAGQLFVDVQPAAPRPHCPSARPRCPSARPHCPSDVVYSSVVEPGYSVIHY